MARSVIDDMRRIYLRCSCVGEVGRRRAGAADPKRSRGHPPLSLSLSLCMCVCVCVVHCELNFFEKASRIGEYASNLSMLASAARHTARDHRAVPPEAH